MAFLVLEATWATSPCPFPFPTGWLFFGELFFEEPPSRRVVNGMPNRLLTAPYIFPGSQDGQMGQYHTIAIWIGR